MSAVAVRVRWHREAWWVFAQSTKIPNRSGKLSRRIGPEPEDELKAGRVAQSLRRQLGERDAAAPFLIGQACLDWIDTYGSTLKPTTVQNTRGMIKNQIIPYLGAKDSGCLRRRISSTTSTSAWRPA